MNKKLEEFFKKQSASNEDSIISKVFKKFKSFPPMKKAMIANMAGHIVIAAIALIVVISIIAFPDAALEFMRGVVGEFGEHMKDFGESISNFISGYGFQTNESLQTEYEEKYYRRLYDVYEYYTNPHNHYEVEVNTTLITATLFYERFGGDLGTDCNDDKCYPGEHIDRNFGTEEEFTKNDVKFYKNAISKIALLARMMLVENELEYDCTATIKKDIIEPDDVRKLVESNTSRWYNIFNFYTIPTRHFTFTVVGKENSDPEDFPTYSMCDMTKYGRNYPSSSDSEDIIEKAKKTSLYTEYLTAYGEYTGAKARVKYCLETGRESYDEISCIDAPSYLNSTETAVAVYEEKFKSLEKIGKFLGLSDDYVLEFDCPEEYYKKSNKGEPICQKDKPLESPIYTSEWYYYGFYYYNLMHAFDHNSSFIEKYYPSYIDPSKREEDLTKIVDGIFGYYNSFIDNMGIYDNEYERGLAYPVKWSGYSTIFMDGLSGSYGILGGGPYATWVQFAGPWAELYMNTLTIRKAGCAFTSICILMAKAHEEVGLDLSMVQPEFNPGNFLGVYKANGGYQGTDGVEWYRFQKIVPGFQVAGSCGNFECIRQHVASGHYCTIHINNKDNGYTFNHWVAVAAIVNGEIYIYDPGRTHTGAEPLSSHYPWTVRMDGGWCYTAGP